MWTWQGRRTDGANVPRGTSGLAIGRVIHEMRIRCCWLSPGPRILTVGTAGWVCRSRASRDARPEVVRRRLKQSQPSEPGGPNVVHRLASPADRSLSAPIAANTMRVVFHVEHATDPTPTAESF